MRDTVRWLLLGFAMTLGMLGVTAPGASATVTGDVNCGGQPVYPWYGDSVAAAVTVPSVADPTVTYPATVLRPADVASYPGARPAIVLQHGRGGGQCALWWAASYLAGHGYVVEVHTAPPSGETAVAFVNALDASRSAFAYLKSPANPYSAYTDPSRLGMAGHSLGSAVTSWIQGEPQVGIDAVVAFDNLRRHMQGDRGGSNDECGGPPSGEVTPTVPALGMAKDEPCNATPEETSPDIKENGWSWWRDHGLPTMELVMRGFRHTDFAGAGTETQKHDVAHYMGAWFDRWLGIDPTDSRLLARTVNGRPVPEILSAHYRSGACLPGAVDTDDFAAWIAVDPVLPVASACGGGPVPPPNPPDPPFRLVSRADVSKLRLSGPRRVRAGRTAILRLRITNRGDAAATGIVIRSRSSNHRVHVRRTMRVRWIGPGRTATVRLKVSATRRARGRTVITAKAAGLRAHRAVEVRARG